MPDSSNTPNCVRVRLGMAWQFIRSQRKRIIVGGICLSLNRLSGLTLPLCSRFLVDNVFLDHQISLLPYLAGWVLIGTAIQGVTAISMDHLLSSQGNRLISELRKRVFAHMNRLFVHFFDLHGTGTLVSRIMSDIEPTRHLLSTGFVDLISNLATAIVAIALMLWISPRITMVALVLFTIFAFSLRRNLREVRPLYKTEAQALSALTGRVTESFSGIRIVKSYCAEHSEMEAFSRQIDKLLANTLLLGAASSKLRLLSTLIIGCIWVCMILLCGTQVVRGNMSVGQYFTYSMLITFVISPLSNVVAVGTQVVQALTGLERAQEILRQPLEEEKHTRTTVLPTIRGHVQFDNVVFSYEKQNPVLNQISFSATPNKLTAIVGPSGAGKSTILNLLCGFYKPHSGQILIDGIDIAHVTLASLRKQLGIVLQETFLFDGTIRANVLLGNPHATESEVLRACSIARVNEFAERFSDGYDTVVGERGAHLSGGQRQRISIARAILANPRVLVFDEATSSLDTESEAMIQAGLTYLLKDRTAFVVAHRLSTVKRADQILVVKHGKIVERGTHATLCQLRGLYHSLYEQQENVEANLFGQI